MDLINKRGNPADMKTRLLINHLTIGRKIKRDKADYEYARTYFPEVVNNLLPQQGATIETVRSEEHTSELQSQR